MKKLLTVISGMLLFACLTTGFISPSHTTVTTTSNVNKGNNRGWHNRYHFSQDGDLKPLIFISLLLFHGKDGNFP